MSRISRDELFLCVAEAFALRSTCSRGQVGCVAVVQDRIVSTGYNGSPPGMPHCLDVGCDLSEGSDAGCQRATHAEANCVAFAARLGTSLIDSTLYTTHSCCRTCAALLVACGVRRVIYLKPYRKSEGLQLLDQADIEVVKYGLE